MRGHCTVCPDLPLEAAERGRRLALSSFLASAWLPLLGWVGRAVLGVTGLRSRLCRASSFYSSQSPVKAEKKKTQPTKKKQ